MQPLVHLDYDLDTDLLLKEAEHAKSSARPYTDSRYPDLELDKWHIGHYSSAYIEQVMLDFKVKGRPRFYWLAPFTDIPEHVDNGTECSLNFILTPNPAPITIEGIEYEYRQVLLNTTLPHSVKNGDTERIMLKISIFDETFEELASRIPYVCK